MKKIIAVMIMVIILCSTLCACGDPVRVSTMEPPVEKVLHETILFEDIITETIITENVQYWD